MLQRRHPTKWPQEMRQHNAVAMLLSKSQRWIGIQMASTMKETEFQTDIGLSDVVAHLEQQHCSTPVAPVIPETSATPVRSEPSLSYRDDPNNDTYEPLSNSSEGSLSSGVSLGQQEGPVSRKFHIYEYSLLNSLRPATFVIFLLKLQ